MNIVRRALPVGVALATLTSASAARANFDIDDDVSAPFNACVAKFKTLGLADLFNQLNGSKHEFDVRSASSASEGTDPNSKSDARDGTGSGAEIDWNPTAAAGFLCEPAVAEDPCATLYHEMKHAAEIDVGAIDDRDDCMFKVSSGDLVDSGLSIAEMDATRAENDYRRAAGLPVRTKYCFSATQGADVTAVAACQPPPTPVKPSGCNGGCSESGDTIGGYGTGDPHIQTFDGYHYDFQAVGEFVLARSTVDAFEVQGRQTAVPAATDASLYSAIAANVLGDRVGVYLDASGMRVMVNGGVTPTPSAFLTLPNAGTIAVDDEGAFVVGWPDGTRMRVRAIAGWGLRVDVELSAGRRGKVEGIFGNDDGDQENDVAGPDGKPLPEPPPFASLYPAFADAWRVTAATSLFDYAEGDTTETFTRHDFPSADASSAGLPGAAIAEAICRAAGVAESTLADCTLDVASTGQPAFAEDFARSASDVPPTLTIASAGSTASLTFEGHAGDRWFVDTPITTLPDDCDPLGLLAPDGTRIAQGCIVNGAGFIDATPLPADGTYLVTLAPTTSATGAARVSLYRDVDAVDSVTVDGPDVLAHIRQPGETATFTFTRARPGAT